MAKIVSIGVQVNASQAVGKIKEIEVQFEKLGKTINSAFSNLKIPTFTKNLQGFQKAAKDTENQVKSLSISFATLGATIASLQLVESGRELATLILSADRLNRVLEGSVSGFEDFNTALNYVRSTASTFGTRIDTLTRGYSQLISATKSSNVTLYDTKDIFEGITSAITALQLSSDDANGAMTAMVQIMSKGKVQAEELRGQLGERIPGAFQLAAQAMGMTTKELDKFMRDGNLISEEFLPKFGRALKEHFGDAAVNSSKSATSAMNRFFNEIFYMSERMGKSGAFDTITKLFDTLSNTLKDSSLTQNLSNVINNIGQSFVNLLPALGAFVDGALIALDTITKSIAQITSFIGTLETLAYILGIVAVSYATIKIGILSFSKIASSAASGLLKTNIALWKLGQLTLNVQNGLMTSSEAFKTLGRSVLNTLPNIVNVGIGIRALNYFIKSLSVLILTTFISSISKAFTSIGLLISAAFTTHPILAFLLVTATVLATLLIDWGKLVDVVKKYNDELSKEKSNTPKFDKLQELNQNRENMITSSGGDESTAEKMYQWQWRQNEELRQEIILRRQNNDLYREYASLIRDIDVPKRAPYNRMGSSVLSQKQIEDIEKLKADTLKAMGRAREAELAELDIKYKKEYETAKLSYQELTALDEWYAAEKSSINKKADLKEEEEKKAAYDIFLDMYSLHLKNMGNLAGEEIAQINNKYQKLRAGIETDPFLNKKGNEDLKKDFITLLDSNKLAETETSTNKFKLLFKEMFESIKKQAVEAKRSIEDLVTTLKDLRNQIKTETENLKIYSTPAEQSQLERTQSSRELSFQYEKDQKELSRKLEDISQKRADDIISLNKEANDKNTVMTSDDYDKRLAIIKEAEEKQTDIIREQVDARNQLYRIQSEAIMSKEMKQNLTDGINYLSDTFTDGFTSIIFGTQSVSAAFKQMTISILQDASKMLMKKGILGILGMVGNAALSYYTGSGTNFMTTDAATGGNVGANASYGTYGRAAGGPVNAGTAYIVGEKGPELLQMGNRGGSITPNNQLGGNSYNINVSVDGSKGGTREQNDRLGKQIANEIKLKVKEIMLDEQRYGGVLNRNTYAFAGR